MKRFLSLSLALVLVSLFSSRVNASQDIPDYSLPEVLQSHKIPLPPTPISPPKPPRPPLIDPQPPLPPGINRVVFSHPKVNQPSPSKTASCPDPITCSDYSFSGIKWANPTGVRVFVDLDNPYGLEDQSAMSEIARSFTVWESANPSKRLDFILAEDNSIEPNPNSPLGPNTVSFRSLNDFGSIGVTTAWYYSSSRAIIKFDLILNTDPGNTWSISSRPPNCSEYPVDTCLGVQTAYDVANITTHEVGHTLMLNDLYRSRDRELTMYGYGKTGELKKTTLGLGDIKGLNKIYP